MHLLVIAVMSDLDSKKLPCQMLQPELVCTASTEQLLVKVCCGCSKILTMVKVWRQRYQTLTPKLIEILCLSLSSDIPPSCVADYHLTGFWNHKDCMPIEFMIQAKGHFRFYSYSVERCSIARHNDQGIFRLHG